MNVKKRLASLVGELADQRAQLEALVRASVSASDPRVLAVVQQIDNLVRDLQAAIKALNSDD